MQRGVDRRDPPGAQPLLPARLMDGMGKTDMPVTTTSEEARRFFNQGVSQIHSFWFQGKQALPLLSTSA